MKRTAIDRKPLGLLPDTPPVVFDEPSDTNGKTTTSVEDELEQLMAEKDDIPFELSQNLDNSPPVDQPRRVSDADIEDELEQLVLEKDQQLLEAVPHESSHSLNPTAVSKNVSTSQRGNLSSMNHVKVKENCDEFSSGFFGREKQTFVRVQEPRKCMGKENISQVMNMEPKARNFDFTPNSVDGGLYVPNEPVR